MRFETLYKIIQSAPRHERQLKSKDWKKQSICYQLLQHAALSLSQARPTEEVFFVDTMDDVAATAAGELSWFIQQGFGTRELDPIEGHVRPF